VASTILAKSKFYGNSTSAILEGTATLSLLPRGEEYFMTLPYAHCKGILMGTMTVELGGKVTIECAKTGYSTEIEFKLRPFLGGGEFTNAISGRILLGKETLATLTGRWDEEVFIKDKQTGVSESFWKVSPEVRQQRLKRFTVPLEDQNEFESARLWRKVSEAIESDDQHEATKQKSVLEEAQRNAAKERKNKGFEWVPKYFELDSESDSYAYLHSDLRPWDPMNDLQQFEKDFVVATRTLHKTPMIRSQSIISDSDVVVVTCGSKLRHRRNTKEKLIKRDSKAAGADPKEAGAKEKQQSAGADLDGEEPDGKRRLDGDGDSVSKCGQLVELLRPLEDQHRSMLERLSKLQRTLVCTYILYHLHGP
jgi:hypothetical protein